MKVVWTEPARDRLSEIEEYIAEDSPDRAVTFLLEPEDEKQSARELIHEGYRILYKIEKNTVYILSVFEGSRLPRSSDLNKP